MRVSSLRADCIKSVLRLGSIYLLQYLVGNRYFHRSRRNSVVDRIERSLSLIKDRHCFAKRTERVTEKVDLLALLSLL